MAMQGSVGELKETIVPTVATIYCVLNSDSSCICWAFTVYSILCVITSFNFHNGYNYHLHLQMRKQSCCEIKSFIQSHLVSNSQSWFLTQINWLRSAFSTPPHRKPDSTTPDQSRYTCCRPSHSQKLRLGHIRDLSQSDTHNGIQPHLACSSRWT